MSQGEEKPAPRLYLIVEPGEPATLAAAIEAACAAADVACLRLLGGDPKALWPAAQALEPICGRREVALLAEDAADFAFSAKLDGVHLTRPADYGAAREAVGEGRIVGVACGLSRHAGLSAAEKGADYVLFEDVAADPEHARDLIAWWAEMIETPCVAQGMADPEAAAVFGPIADFLAPQPALLFQPEALKAIHEAAATANAAAQNR